MMLKYQYVIDNALIAACTMWTTNYMYTQTENTSAISCDINTSRKGKRSSHNSSLPWLTNILKASGGH